MNTNERRARIALAIGPVLLALGVALTLWDASDDSGDEPAPVTGRGEEGIEEGIVRVPAERGTIQEAVDAAAPGDLILVAPGVYPETVIIETDDLVIRGLDRNEVVVDGEFTRETGIIVFSDGVAVENLTVRNHTENGLFFTGDYDSQTVLRGYRASYVTAHNNGRYGIYGFNATYGLIEHSYGSGHPESAFYIGQCSPCEALLIDSAAEHNTYGYIGTNASRDLYLAGNRFTHNRIGAAPHSGSHEELPPQRDSVLVGNAFEANNSDLNLLGDRTRDIDRLIPVGVGVWIRGGIDNVVTRNRFVDNLNAGVFVDVNIDDEQWVASGNRVVDNEVAGSVFGLVLVVPDAAAGPLGNCFEGNGTAGIVPVDLDAVAPCGREPTLPLTETPGRDRFEDVDETETSYRDVPPPPPQPQMPDAATAPADPASTIERLDRFDPDSVPHPSP